MCTLTGGVDPLEGVATVALHVAEAVGSAPVGEEHGGAVKRLGDIDEEVEESVEVEQEVLGIAGLRADNVGSQGRIAREEDREVQT
jgi:hypothetical protein